MLYGDLIPRHNDDPKQEVDSKSTTLPYIDWNWGQQDWGRCQWHFGKGTNETAQERDKLRFLFFL